MQPTLSKYKLELPIKKSLQTMQVPWLKMLQMPCVVQNVRKHMFQDALRNIRLWCLILFNTQFCVNSRCNKQNMFAEYTFLPFFFTLNKKCYKMLLNEIIVSTTVKSKEIKTVQINHKDLRKKLLGIPITPIVSIFSVFAVS